VMFFLTAYRLRGDCDRYVVLSKSRHLIRSPEEGGIESVVKDTSVVRIIEMGKDLKVVKIDTVTSGWNNLKPDVLLALNPSKIKKQTEPIFQSREIVDLLTETADTQANKLTALSYGNRTYHHDFG